VLDFLSNSLFLLFGFSTSVFFGDILKIDKNSILDLSLTLMVLFFASVGLFYYGPNAFAFGLFLGAGWNILNSILDNILSIDHHQRD